jgi:hypothetical protein
MSEQEPQVIRDWSLDERPYYTIGKFVCLWCEVPDDMTKESVVERYPLVSVRLQLILDAVLGKKLPSYAGPDDSESPRDPRDRFSFLHTQLIRHDDLQKWFKKYRKERPPLLFPDHGVKPVKQDEPDTQPIAPQSEDVASSTTAEPTTGTSECDGLTYDTGLLQVARWVIATWWEGKDPKKGPIKPDMIEKLQMLEDLSSGKFRDLTKGEAEAVDLVTRPDSVRHAAPIVPTKKSSNRKG